MNGSTTPSRNFFLAAVVAFWALLWTAGLPPPHWDDLFFVGGAFQLAETGQLANPLIRLWSPVAAERYFFQPPFFQYTLAGWIKLFGISAWSLLGFQCLALVVCSLSAMLLLRKYGLSGWRVLPIFLAFAMMPQGLRHDTLGLAFLAAGLWFLSFPGTVRTFAGAFLAASSVATWPLLMVYAVPFTAAQLGAGRPPASYLSRNAARRFAACLAGAGTAFLLFLASIGFRVGEFLEDFVWHSRLRLPTWRKILPDLWLQLTNGYAEILSPPTYALFLLLTLGMVLRWKETRVKARIFFCALWTGILANLVLYPSFLHVLVDFFCWVGIVALLWEVPMSRAARKAGVAVAAAAFLLAQSYILLAWAGRQSLPAERHDTVREALRRPPPGPLAVDEIAARFIFDYRLPPGAVFWNYSRPPAKTWPASTMEKEPGEIWVLSPVKSQVTKGIPPSPRVRLFGREFGSMSASPYDVAIIE